MSQTSSYYSNIPITITTTTTNIVILTFTITVGAPFQERFWLLGVTKTRIFKSKVISHFIHDSDQQMHFSWIFSTNNRLSFHFTYMFWGKSTSIMWCYVLPEKEAIATAAATTVQVHLSGSWLSGSVGTSDKFVVNSTKLTWLEIIDY
jgi:hypothetical protein